MPALNPPSTATGLQVEKADTIAGTRTNVNLIDGANVSQTVVDSSVDDEVQVTTAITGVPSNVRSGVWLLAWNYDLAWSGQSVVPTTLKYYYCKVRVPRTITITKVAYAVGATAASGLVAGSNRVGICDSAGTLLSQSNDITSIPVSTIVSASLQSPVTVTGGPTVVVWLIAMVSASTMPNVKVMDTISASHLCLGGGGAPYAMFRYLEATVASGNPLPSTINTNLTGTATASQTSLWLGAS